MRKGKALLLLLLAAVILIVAGAVATVRRGFSARDEPSALEKYVARTARKLAIPSKASSERNPFTASPELIAEARAHFADHCAICHANNGSGNTEIGRNLYPKAPDMRLPQTQNLTDGELDYTIHNGIRLTGMPAWGSSEGKDDDSWKLVLFIRYLPQLTPAEEHEMESLNPKGREERQEEQVEEQFLNGEPNRQSPKQPVHPHPKEEKQ